MTRFTGPLEDRVAIRELVDSYIDAVYRRDADDWEQMWCEDATWSLSRGTQTGRANIRKQWEGAMAGFTQASMYATGGHLSVNGDAAEGRWYMLELLTLQDGKEMAVSGRYDDEYRRCEDGLWRFSKRTYTVQQMPSWTAKG